MIKKLRKKLSNLKLKYKIVLIYCLAGFLPVLVTFFVSFFQMSGILRENATENINSYLFQATETQDV